jgi:hypothetical protein
MWGKWRLSNLRLILKSKDIRYIIMNATNPWTPEEELKMVNAVKEKVTYEQIAESHGRSVNSIKYRLLAYAVDMVLKNGAKEADLVLELGLYEDDLKKELRRREAPKPVDSKPVAKPVATKPVAKPVATKPVAKPVATKAKSTLTGVDELKDILKLVDSLQGRLTRYINASK